MFPKKSVYVCPRDHGPWKVIGFFKLEEKMIYCLNKLNFCYYRGRYSVELHFSFLRIQGQANDFKIQYSSVVRLFVLPKVHFISWYMLRLLQLLV